ncbi:MAG: hypothetical protein ACI82S_003281 [Patiriisocius sp.]|jgi:hypothetical protein
MSYRPAGSPELCKKDITTCTRSMTAKRQPITNTAVEGISSIGRIAFPFTQQGQHA